MLRKSLVAVAILGLAVSTASAQDAKTVLANASKATGVDGLNSIYFYGTAQSGNLGQNNNANQPWPKTAMNDYVRAIDFSKATSRATWATYAVPVTGGRASLVTGTPQTQQLITPETTAWAQQLRLMQATVLDSIAERFPAAGVEKAQFFGPHAPSWKHGPKAVPGRGPRDTYG